MKNKHLLRYVIAAITWTLVFLICVFVAGVPGMYPRDRLIWIAIAILSLGPAVVLGFVPDAMTQRPFAQIPVGTLISLLLAWEMVEGLLGLWDAVREFSRYRGP